MSRRLTPWWLVILVATTVLSPSTSSAVYPAQPGPVAGKAADRTVREPVRVVTLITGDRVMVGGAVEQFSVIPGEGRRKIGFRSLRVRGKFYVIPSDVSRLVASGRLDRRLFDITGLLSMGLDDSRSGSLPLIVTYAGRAGAASVRTGGGEVVRQLPSVNGAAVRVLKKGGSSFASGERLAGGIERVWLDGLRRPLLDESVPQIGGPVAWQAGYTGKGVTVAVLDTGIDATHPELADRIAEARNFTTDPDGDGVGHGTHVASTIAGTGERYRGVAPDAKLLDGKVCDIGGCSESALLAGMEWAASEKKADVINVSIGGGDAPEIDPLEEAVNTLTARTGSLFVIAAGNGGHSGVPSIESPGSADAALTVGAVDKHDEIAAFSSRGPRVGDGAIKPDITAPGVGIAAAKSKDGIIGEPVDDRHVRLDGTSMATPHVAGAAALLKQQHPSWKASELKSAVTASAKRHPAQDVFEQGAGRVDVTRAIRQTVVTEPGSLSFGIARWPHGDDAPAVKQLTYRNLGGTDVTLDLVADVTGPDGRPAPATALTLSASTVTVPAGGTASVTVTSNTRHNGPDGVYSGRVTAAGPDDVSVTTPLSVEKEVESYDLTVTHLDPTGQPTGLADTIVIGLDNPSDLLVFDEDGIATVRLPRGRYFVDGLIAGVQEDLHQLIQPVLRLDRDTAVSMDARLTRPMRTTLPRPEAKLSLMSIGWTLDTPDNDVSGSLHAYFGETLFTAPLGDPAMAPDVFTAHVVSAWGVPGPAGDFVNTPFTYHLVDTQPGKLWHGFDRVVRDSELAVVRSHRNVQADQTPAVRRVVWKALQGSRPGMGPAIPPSFQFDLPSVATQYVEAKGTRWFAVVSEILVDDAGPFRFVTHLFSWGETYRAGGRYTDRWGAAVFGPGFVPRPFGYGKRLGDRISVNLSMYSDQDRHDGLSATDTASTKLYRNGVLIGESDLNGSLEARGVPGEPADMTLVSTATRATISNFSTRTNAVWTFRSQAAVDETLPLWGVRYLPSVDVNNAARRQPVTVLPVVLETETGAKAGKPTRVEVRVSGDDGTTWTNAAIRRTGDNRYVAVFATPKGGYVSLKAKVADSFGNTTEQTIVHAYALR